MTERPAQRTPNRQLAALIAEAGFSNAGLARRVDQLGLEHGLDLRYDKTSVTRWLRGQQPRGTTPALIAEVFTRRLGRRLTAQDLGLDACAPVYAGLEFAATPEEAVDIVGGLWRKDSGSHAELRKIAFTPAGLVVPSRDWLIGRADDRVGRGDPGARPGSPYRAARPCPGSAAQTERGPGQRVTGGDIAALRSVGELFRTLDNAYGGGHARQALVRYLEHELEPMLRGTYGEQTGRRLFAAASDLTRLAGWTSYDIAAHGLAQRYFVQALRLSQAAGDRAYGSYVLVTMSRQAVYLGHGREAVQLARVAQQGVGLVGPARGAGAAARGRGARARGARRGAGRHGVTGARRAGPGDRPARRRSPVLGTVLRRGAARRRVRALPPRPPAVPGRSPACRALAAVAGARVRAQPAVLPGRPRLGTARARRARPGLPVGRGGRGAGVRRCGRCGRWSTCGTSNGDWSRTGTRRRSAGTATGSRRLADGTTGRVGLRLRAGCGWPRSSPRPDGARWSRISTQSRVLDGALRSRMSIQPPRL